MSFINSIKLIRISEMTPVMIMPSINRSIFVNSNVSIAAATANWATLYAAGINVVSFIVSIRFEILSILASSFLNLTINCGAVPLCAIDTISYLSHPLPNLHPFVSIHYF
jgi:hypothetical protein